MAVQKQFFYIFVFALVLYDVEIITCYTSSRKCRVKSFVEEGERERMKEQITLLEKKV